MKEPVFEQILQVCIVVRDVHKAVKIWSECYGIGPWEIVEADETKIHNYVVHGELCNEPHKALVAMSQIGNMYLEIIEPVSENSVYQEFLREHGPGLHHLAVKHNDAFIPLMKERSIEEICSLVFGERFCAYYDTREDLGFITEIF